jgi:hypothetical protein
LFSLVPPSRPVAGAVYFAHRPMPPPTTHPGLQPLARTGRSVLWSGDQLSSPRPIDPKGKGGILHSRASSEARLVPSGRVGQCALAAVARATIPNCAGSCGRSSSRSGRGASRPFSSPQIARAWPERPLRRRDRC